MLQVTVRHHPHMQSKVIWQHSAAHGMLATYKVSLSLAVSDRSWVHMLQAAPNMAVCSHMLLLFCHALLHSCLLRPSHCLQYKRVYQLVSFIFWIILFSVQVQLRTDVLRTPSSTRLGFELTTSRSWQLHTFHVTETAALTTQPSVTCTPSCSAMLKFLSSYEMSCPYMVQALPNIMANSHTHSILTCTFVVITPPPSTHTHTHTDTHTYTHPMFSCLQNNYIITVSLSLSSEKSW